MPVPDEIVAHKDLSATDLKKVEALLEATDPNYATKLLQEYDLEWAFRSNPKAPNDIESVEIIPQMRSKTSKQLRNGPFVITMPPVGTAYSMVKAKEILSDCARNNKAITECRLEINPTDFDKTPTDRFESFKRVQEKLSYFGNEQRAEFLIKNIGKHAYFSKNQETTLQKIIKKSGDGEAIAKVIEWMSDGDNRSHYMFRCRIRKKLFAPIDENRNVGDRGQVLTEAFEQDTNEFSDVLKLNPKLKFRMQKMSWPDGKTVQAEDTHLLQCNNMVLSMTLNISRLNKSAHGGAVSVVTFAENVRIITNGVPYGSANKVDVANINVFDALNGNDNAVNLTSVLGPSKTDKANEVRQTLKKKHEGSQPQSRKNKKIKSEDFVHSDED